MSDVPGPKQEDFGVQPQTSGWHSHPTVPAMPTASAMSTGWLSPMGSTRAAPALHPPTPHNQSWWSGWAGDLGMLRQGK